MQVLEELLPEFNLLSFTKENEVWFRSIGLTSILKRPKTHIILDSMFVKPDQAACKDTSTARIKIDWENEIVTYKKVKIGEIIPYSSCKSTQQIGKHVRFELNNYFQAALLKSKYKERKYSKLVIYCHGYNESVLDSIRFWNQMQLKLSLTPDTNEFAFSCLAVEFPGYLNAPGKATFESVCLAVESAIEFALGDLGYACNDIILMGFSSGAEVMLQVASLPKIDVSQVIVLDASETSSGLVGQFRPKLVSVLNKLSLFEEVFDSKISIRAIRAPVLLVASKHVDSLLQSSENIYASGVEAGTDVKLLAIDSKVCSADHFFLHSEVLEDLLLRLCMNT